MKPFLIAMLTLAGAAPPAMAGGTLQVPVHGRAFTLAHIPPASPARGVAALFLPGDGGWRGFAVTIGNRMAAGGYDVYALDTRDYLEAFTGSNSAGQIAVDLDTIATSIRRATGTPVTLVGWSEGAAMVIAAGALRPAAFTGVVAFGVPDEAALGWRMRDSLASLAGRGPDEPQFQVAPLLSRLTSVPLVMIQATRDPFTTMERAQELFRLASGPKRLQFIDAHNHRFDGGTEWFFNALLDGLGWVQRAVQPAARQANVRIP